MVKTILRSAMAGFAFGEAALFAVEPTLERDAVLLTAATLAAGRAGSTGVGAVAACLVFASVLISLGSSFLFAAMVMKLWTRVGERMPSLGQTLTGASLAVAAVTSGMLSGALPLWIYITSQGIVVLAVYSYSSNINGVATALLIIFTTLYLSVVYGRMGATLGLVLMCLTISVFYGLRKVLTEKMTQRPDTRCPLLKRIFFYSIAVGIMGFSIGLAAGEAAEGTEAEVVLMLQSVLWVAFLTAGLLGAGLGTVAMVGMGSEVAGKITLGAAIVSSIALRVILLSRSSLGAHSCLGGYLGATSAAGVALGAASVAAKQAMESRNSLLTVLSSVVAGAVLAMQGVALKETHLTTSAFVIITLVAAMAFVLGAPTSPFHTPVNLQGGLLIGPQLIIAIGMETVTAAAAPIGAGALGAAALGTAGLGRLGTVGVLVAIVLALGRTLSGMTEGSPTANAHRD